MNKLSKSEMLIMKIIWNSKEALEFSEIMEQAHIMNKSLQWNKSTIYTFLLRLKNKGFIASLKNDVRMKYVPLISSNDYFEFLFKEKIDLYTNIELKELILWKLNKTINGKNIAYMNTIFDKISKELD